MFPGSPPRRRRLRHADDPAQVRFRAEFFFRGSFGRIWLASLLIFLPTALSGDSVWVCMQGMRLAAAAAGRGRGVAVPAPGVRRRVPRVGVPEPAHDAVGLRRGRSVSASFPLPHLVSSVPTTTSTSARSFACVGLELRE
jgi:hypothetical protein